MRLPRWLIVCLIATIVAALGGGGLWWFAYWPNHTVSQFREALHGGQFDHVNALLAPRDAIVRANGTQVYFDRNGVHMFRPEHWSQFQQCTAADIELTPPDIADFLAGRRKFEFQNFSFKFVAQFGR